MTGKKKRIAMILVVCLGVVVLFVIIKRYNKLNTINRIQVECVQQIPINDYKFTYRIIENKQSLQEFEEKENVTILGELNFDDNDIFISAGHAVKAFSYQEKNQKYALKEGENILDIVFYKKSENKMYVYKIPKNFTTWNLKKIAPPEVKFED